MMLFVDGVSSGIECPNVGYWIEDYESAFELLTGLVADEWILRYAVIVDNGDALEVPLEAFDGQPIRIHIHALQQEWDRLLSEKPERSNQFSGLRLKNHFLRLDEYYVGLLKHLEKMIFLLEIDKNKIERKQDKELRLRLVNQFTLRLDINRRMYQHTKEDRQNNLLRLAMLENQQR